MVIAGDEIVMRRQELTAHETRMFGDPEFNTVIEDWREQYDPETPALHMTLIATAQKQFIVIVWAQQNDMAEELRRHGIQMGLSIDMFGIGELDVHNEADARKVMHGIAGMVARAELPWPPQDHIDTKVWRTAEAALYRAL